MANATAAWTVKRISETSVLPQVQEHERVMLFSRKGATSNSESSDRWGWFTVLLLQGLPFVNIPSEHLF